MEILILYLKYLYKNFDINELNYENPNSISAYIYQVSLYIFKLSNLDFNIYSSFPAHIILVSSVFINLNKENEKRALKKLQKEFFNEIEDIQICIGMIEKMMKKIFRNKSEDQANFEKMNFSSFFKSQN